MHYRPSFIAAAAVLAAFDGQLTRETMEVKMNVISALGSLEIVSFPTSKNPFVVLFKILG